MPKGDPINAYEFWDDGTASTSGYFALDGVKQIAGGAISVARRLLLGL
jgi:hypothetical protein